MSSSTKPTIITFGDDDMAWLRCLLRFGVCCYETNWIVYRIITFPKKCVIVFRQYKNLIRALKVF